MTCKSCGNPKAQHWGSACANLCVECFVMWALIISRRRGIKD